MTYPFSTPTEIFYPEDDGKPMAENTKQYYWIVVIKENLEIVLANTLDAFIAGDLLWYPIEGDPSTCTAPDVMVVMGRPKGHRRSYQQWKEQDIPPTVVFEIMSPRNSHPEMMEKRDFYALHGVDEFYIYDPDRNKLTGYIRQGRELRSIDNIEGWMSPSLKITFSHRHGELEIYGPNGQRFLNTLELNRLKIEAENRATEAEKERDIVVQERDLVSQERDRLLEQLRALGINPEL